MQSSIGNASYVGAEICEWKFVLRMKETPFLKTPGRPFKLHSGTKQFRLLVFTFGHGHNNCRFDAIRSVNVSLADQHLSVSKSVANFITNSSINKSVC